METCGRAPKGVRGKRPAHNGEERKRNLNQRNLGVNPGVEWITWAMS